MAESPLTETIKCKILYKTPKTVFVEFQDGSHCSIPDSLIHNTIDYADTELEQEIIVEKWFCDKNIKNGWY